MNRRSLLGLGATGLAATAASPGPAPSSASIFADTMAEMTWHEADSAAA